jgi:hypothetical protein
MMREQSDLTETSPISDLFGFKILDAEIKGNHFAQPSFPQKAQPQIDIPSQNVY